MTRSLSRHQVETWRDNWSYADRVLIEHALDLLPDHDYYEPRTAQYVGARVGGRVALYIAPGYLYWPKGTWSADVDPALVAGRLETDPSDGSSIFFALSTFRSQTGSKPHFEELRAPCPVCFMEPSVSGSCGCD